LLSINKIYSVSVDDAVTLTLNFKVVGNQVNRAARDERVLGLGRRIAKATGIAARRVAASSLDIAHGLALRLTEATLSLTAHVVGLLTTKLTALAAVMRRLLHVVAWVGEVVGRLSLHGVHLLLGAHELVLLVGLGLAGATPILLLV
jgi:hypothetical protein